MPTSTKIKKVSQKPLKAHLNEFCKRRNPLDRQINRRGRERILFLLGKIIKGKAKRPYYVNHEEYFFLYLLEHWTLEKEPPSEKEWKRLWNVICDASYQCVVYGMKHKTPKEEWRDDIFSDYVIKHIENENTRKSTILPRIEHGR